jgi:small subunit ribosomal protein S16
MVKIRLARRGSRNKAFYRIVAVCEQVKKSAPALDILGIYQPSKKVFSIDLKKLDLWVKKGALISPALSNLIAKYGSKANDKEVSTKEATQPEAKINKVPLKAK